MTIRTMACSCSLSARPFRRSLASPRLRFSALVCWWAGTASSDMLGVLDTALGGQVDADRGTAADGAADVERAAMQAGQLDGKRKAQPRAGMGDQRRFVDPPKTRLGQGNILLCTAHAGVRNDEAQAALVIDAGDH